MVWLGGLFNRNVREVRETLHQWQEPFVVDAGKYHRAFGPFDVTPHRDAIAQTVSWFRAGSPPVPGDVTAPPLRGVARGH